MGATVASAFVVRRRPRPSLRRRRLNLSPPHRPPWGTFFVDMDAISIHTRTKAQRSLAEILGDKYEIIPGDPTNTESLGDLLILDHSTYQQNGPEAIEAFKQQDPQLAHPVLLLVSADWMKQLRSHVWDQIDDLVGLPPRLPELKGRIRVLLQWHQSSVEAQRYMRLVRGARGDAATYKGLFSDHPCGVLLLKDGAVEEANPRAERLFDATAQELQGRTLASLSPGGGDEPSESVPPLAAAGGGDEPQASWNFERPNGETFEARLSVGMVTIGDETFVEVVLYEPL